MLNDEIADYYGHFRVTPDLIELRNMLQTADLIVRSALHRQESRGLHYKLDYPETLPAAVDTVLVPRRGMHGSSCIYRHSPKASRATMFLSWGKQHHSRYRKPRGASMFE